MSVWTAVTGIIRIDGFISSLISEEGNKQMKEELSKALYENVPVGSEGPVDIYISNNGGIVSISGDLRDFETEEQFDTIRKWFKTFVLGRYNTFSIRDAVISTTGYFNRVIKFYEVYDMYGCIKEDRISETNIPYESIPSKIIPVSERSVG